MIKAIHPATGRKGEFSNEAWELLPEGKDGWQIEIPEEVADTIDEKKQGRRRGQKDGEAKKTEETAGEGDPAGQENAGEGDPAGEETDL